VDTYKQSYIGKYISAHQVHFYDKFTGLFDQNVDRSFATERTKKYSEHKSAAIAVTKKEGEIVGRAEARSASYDQAYAQNYPLALDREKARVDSVATEQVNALERSQAVIALNRDKYSLNLDAKLGAAPGTDVALNLELKNLGLKANTLGLVQLEVIESENIEIAQKVVLLKDLPAKSNINLKNVLKFKVAQRAVPGQDFKLKLRLTAHDGADFGNRMQELVVRDRVRVNPEATSQLSFEAKPKLRKMIIPGILHIYPKHQIGVQVKALFAGLSEGYDVEINAINTDKHKVELLNSVAKTKVLRQNESETIYFTYKFKKKARKKTVQFKVLVKYMGELIREENLTVTPE
jgi:hypothetical protein